MINSVYINNFKSLVDFHLEKPNPFTVFIGPNASGKTSIFEALESLSLFYSFFSNELIEENLFEDYFIDDLVNKNKSQTSDFSVSVKGDENELQYFSEAKNYTKEKFTTNQLNFRNAMSYDEKFLKFFIKNFSRLFIENNSIDKIIIPSNKKLFPSAQNLELVLNRILKNATIKEEIIEWLSLMIPEFEDLIIEKSGISGKLNFYIKEKFTQSPFPKHLLSNGTYNIIAILTAVFQNEGSPQFLCIDEPENGLNPKVIKELLNLFRQRCEENGDYIWINTHNPYLLKFLKPEEVVVIEKEKGITNATQIKDVDLSGLSLEEAYFTNTIGGLPW